MTQYIDKDKIVAEIERRKIPFKRDIEDGNYPTYLCALMDFEDFLDTLEVKDVDLEKEIMKYQREIYDRDTTVRDVAKHFFELGLKAQKGE